MLYHILRRQTGPSSFEYVQRLEEVPSRYSCALPLSCLISKHRLCSAHSDLATDLVHGNCGIVWSHNTLVTRATQVKICWQEYIQTFAWQTVWRHWKTHLQPSLGSVAVTWTANATILLPHSEYHIPCFYNPETGYAKLHSRHLQPWHCCICPYGHKSQHQPCSKLLWYRICSCSLFWQMQVQQNLHLRTNNNFVMTYSHVTSCEHIDLYDATYQHSHFEYVNYM